MGLDKPIIEVIKPFIRTDDLVERVPEETNSGPFPGSHSVLSAMKVFVRAVFRELATGVARREKVTVC